MSLGWRWGMAGLVVLSSSAALLGWTRAAVRPADKPPAVVMDLDETILDNSRFQVDLILRDDSYTEALWNAWVRDHGDEVGLVPGAKEFLMAARALGVQVVYLSNRPDALKQFTEATLQRLGIAFHADLLLQKPNETKIQRRRAVEARFDVLAYFGDSLTDFPGEFELDRARDYADEKARHAALQRRKEQVIRQERRFGEDWFMLPNPVYGDWRRLTPSTHVERFLRAMNGSPNPPPDLALTPKSDVTALLWTQNSGEYEALCRQVYRHGLLVIKEKMRARPSAAR
jgi:5'-nucleotidase (lipoprotein e(P4) family)